MNTIICSRFSAAAGVFFIFCLPTLSSGQTLNLYDAISQAVSNYPQIHQREAEVAAGRAHITTVNGNRLPSLILQDQLDAGTDKSLQGAYFSLGMIPSTPGSYTSTRNNPILGNTGISFLQWDFYRFGYYNAQKREAVAELGINEANLNRDTYTLKESVISLYLDWLKKYRLLRIQTENVQRATVILTDIRATVLSGLKPGVDSSTASASYAAARIEYLKALDDYNYDGIELGVYTGVYVNNIIPDTSVLNPLLLQHPIQAATQVTLTDSVASDHPLIEAYQKQYEQQVADNNTVSRKYLPHLGVTGAAWERSSGISPAQVYPNNLASGMPYTRSNYLLGLTLTYNFFDLKHRHDELVEGKYLAQAKQSAVATQQISLNAMIQQANASYTTTVEKLKEIPVELNSSQVAYGQQVALYKAGLNTLIDVTNAQYQLLQAETDYVLTQDALLQLLYIRAGLGGELDIFLQNFKK